MIDLNRLRTAATPAGKAPATLTAIGAIAAALLAATPAEAALVSACSGVSLPPSAVTGILSPVLTGIVNPIQTDINAILGVPAVGGILGLPPLSIGLTGPGGLLTNAAAGAPISLSVIRNDGLVFGPADTCNTTTDSLQLNTPKGISLGGNMVTGLGSGAVANAGSLSAIALGNNATTTSGVANAIAIGSGASATVAGGVAIGANSVDKAASPTAGATIGGTAYTFAGAAPTSVVSVGAAGAERQIANVAAGRLSAASTDAVNGSQLFATNTAVNANTTAIAGVSAGTAGTVQRRPAVQNILVLTAPGGTGAVPGPAQTLGNVAPGSLAAGSTDAVNGGQLATTNANVAANTTNITNLTNGTAGLVQQTGGAPGAGQITVGAATGGTSISVAGTGGNRVISGVAAGVAPTDAVDVGQLNGAIGAATANAVQYDTAGKTMVTLGGVGAAAPTTLTNVAAGALTPTSTDAVNGSQLAATNANVTTNTTNIAGNTTAITNLSSGAAGTVQRTATANNLTLTAPGGTGAAPGAAQVLSNVAAGVAPTDAVNLGQVGSLVGATAAAAPIQYSTAAAPTTANPGVASNDTTLVGAMGGSPVALHNVAAGSLAAGSTDAVNGGQLAATNANVATNTTNIATNTANIAGNTTAITNLSAGINNGTLGLVQQTGGSPGAGTITVGAATGGTVVDFTGTGGTRTLTGVTAGVAPTDAVNVSQLTTTVGAATANAVQYDTAGKTMVTLGGVGAAAPTTLTNVAAGALTPTSTDAVNGSQLAATNANVTTNTTNIAGNTTAITNLSSGAAGTVQRTATANNLTLTAPGGTGAAPGAAQVLSNVAAGVAPTDAVNLGQVGSLVGATAAAAPIQYSTAAAPTTANPGVASNDTTLVGAMGGSPVALHNVAAGSLAAGSTDAVNGGQLAATNANVATNTTNIATNTANIAGNTTAITALNNGTAGLVQQTGGAPGTGQITVGAATGGTSVSIASMGGGNRTLTGLSAGLAGNDAVTVAQVNGLTAGGLNNVQYDPTATNGRSNTITLAGGAAGPVAINNVAPAVLAAGSTGAVNGGQLYTTNQQLASLSNGTAGAFQSNNAAGAPPPVASGANASAAGFGASATGAGGLALGNGATSTGTGSVAIGQNSTDGGVAGVVSVGGVGSERRVTNVAPALNGTDAVNLSQLQAATNSFTTTTTGLQNEINQTNFDLNQVRRRANGGTAGAMAVAGLPQAFEPGKSMIGGAVGYWADQVAFAIGVSSIVGERTVIKAGGSISQQGVGGFNAGVGFQF